MDKTNNERSALQKQQLREWCAAQIAEKEAAKAADLAAERYVWTSVSDVAVGNVNLCHPVRAYRNYCQTQAEVQAELNQLISYHDDTKKQYTLANAAENAALVNI